MVDLNVKIGPVLGADRRRAAEELAAEMAGTLGRQVTLNLG